MATSPLQEHIEKRYKQVNEHLELIVLIEKAQTRQLDNPLPFDVSVDQINVLQSTVYLMLYNMVESTMSEISDHVASQLNQACFSPNQVPEPLLREWLRVETKTHERRGITEDDQLEVITKLFHTYANGEAVLFSDFKPIRGANWGEKTIKAFLNGQLGIPIPDKLDTTNGNPPTLKTILDKRNGLAHGRLSFTDAMAKGATTRHLKDTAEEVYATLMAIVANVETYLTDTIPTTSGEEAT